MENGLNRIKRFGYSDILGWSVSRYEKFLLCKRQYFYDYYAKYDTQYPRAIINTLKAMTSMPLEIGNIVHDTIKTLLERLLKSEGPIDADKFIEYGRRKTDEYCKSKMFTEVYYKEIDKVNVDEIYDAVRINLSNFITSKRFLWITNKAINNKYGWVIEPPGFGETRINNLKAYCKVDFLFPVDDKLYILDWKTGKQNENKHKKQLVGYTTWASYHFEKSPEMIVPIVVYLQPEYSEMSLQFNELDLQEFTGLVESETQDMYSYCKNTELNIPKEKEEFSKTNNATICRFCNYKELCGFSVVSS